MKVAIINPVLTEHRNRGTGIYALNLIEALKKHTKIHVVEASINNLPINVDLYHFPYFDPFFLTLPIFKKNKTIVTIHDLIPIRFPENFPRGIVGEIKWLIQKRIVRNVDAIITDSHASAIDIKSFLNVQEEKVFVVYLSPALSYSQPVSGQCIDQVISKYRLPAKFILFVGDVNWNKNLPNIIKASKVTNYPLVIVSKAFTNFNINADNPWLKSLNEAKKLAQEYKDVYSLGFVSQEELKAIYKSATLLVVPSYYEGFGMPVVEAFAVGCPVITSNRGSLKEIADSAAYFVNPESVESIVQGINVLGSDNSLRVKFIHKGLIQAQKFNWEKVARETENIYNIVIDNDYPT